MKLRVRSGWFLVLISFIVNLFFLVLVVEKIRYSNAGQSLDNDFYEMISDVDRLRVDVSIFDVGDHPILLKDLRIRFLENVDKIEKMDGLSNNSQRELKGRYKSINSQINSYIQLLEGFSNHQYKLYLLSKKVDSIWSDDQMFSAHYEVYRSDLRLIERMLANYKPLKADKLKKRILRNQTVVSSMPYDMKFEVLDAYYSRAFSALEARARLYSQRRNLHDAQTSAISDEYGMSTLFPIRSESKVVQIYSEMTFLYFLISSVLFVVNLYMTLTIKARPARKVKVFCPGEDTTKNTAVSSAEKSQVTVAKDRCIKDIQLTEMLPAIVEPIRRSVGSWAKIKVELKPRDLIVRCAPIMLTYMIEKLINQAVEAQKKSVVFKKQRMITLRCESRDGHIKISVHDNVLAKESTNDQVSVAHIREQYNKNKLAKLDQLLKQKKGYLECTYDLTGGANISVIWPIESNVETCRRRESKMRKDSLRFHENSLILKK